MGEMNPCNIEREPRPANGLMTALMLLSEYPPGQSLPAAKFTDLRQVMEACAVDDCHHCAHAAPCRAAYDELSNRVK